MKPHKLFILTLLLSLMVGCDNEPKDPNELFAMVFNDGKKAFTTDGLAKITISDKKNSTIESVSYTLDGTMVGTSEGTKEVGISLANLKMGKRKLVASIVSEGKIYSISDELIIKASKRPDLYTYKILETYPHDIEAYTQGLEFENDTLYESTGQRKKSTLRKTNYKTGKVYKSIPLADQYFGEGLTILNDKIHQLTWQAKTGFIYDLKSMEKEGTFVYGKSREGWGLCNDGTAIYKSDGTQKIWTLDPNTLAEESYIEIYTNSAVIDNVNELEWVDGKIYANIYQAGAIAIVNPTNGAVDGVIDLNGLKEKVAQHPALDVLNGIAYNGEPNILYVTGKNWDKLFKIEIIKK